MTQLSRTEFSAAVAELARERGIDSAIVLSSIEEAILAAYVRDAQEADSFHDDWQYRVSLDNQTGGVKIYGHPEDKPDQELEVTPPGFGRIATQTAKQVILQKVREAEKSAIIDDYQDKIGLVVMGTVIRQDGRRVVVDIGRTYGILPLSEQVRGEDYSIGVKLSFLIKEIVDIEDQGRQIILSRTSVDLVKALFRREVPEINNNTVDIRAIARQPGTRTKLAVYSNRRGVDPVGACVGQKGVRVAEVIKALGGEKVDVIQFFDDPEKLIAASLLPAEELVIEINQDERKAKVSAPEDQLSLAIGKDGQNVRLASQLSDYEIDIDSSSPIKAKQIKTEEEEEKDEKQSGQNE
ncbi:MAG: transcription termination factor NusA [Candidatus Shapirobacteria bacterium]|nr:transcription termination factor NusA [Candidatus Shapirobacteria bacterium]MDD5073679.1 transcription termination factor NusA [Candidatus Shapirobacteria bacterium]MDD5481441.1 transcription termination factor NusA [Candidatus Shapirobacteria bacterium]